MKSGKRFLSLLLACILTLSLLPTAAFAAEGDFVIENGVLTKYKGSGGDVTIPSGVTSIGVKAFHGCSKLTSVTIPNSVTSIGDYAFSRCFSLTSVTIPNSVTSIGNQAFWFCEELTSVTIPNSVTSIGDRAFHDCTGLTSVTIPNSVTSIGLGVFGGCSELSEIQVDRDNPAYSSLDGVLFNKNQTVLVCYPCGKSGDDYVIPNGVTSIGDRAFSGRTITSVTIPNSVMSIGDRAFSGCTITSVTIPSSVMSIGEGAFGECFELTEIQVDRDNPAYSSLDGVLFDKAHTVLVCYPCDKQGDYIIPDGVTSISNGAFFLCSKLTSVTIPNSVTSIGDYAFSGCTITSVAIPNSMTSIGDEAFCACYNLTSVTIPNSVTSIRYDAFSGCNALTDVYYGGSEEQWQAINICDDDGSLRNATIHYNVPAPAPENITVEYENPAAGDFTVTSEKPCAVLYDGGNGCQMLKASPVSGGTYAFTLPEGFRASGRIVVAVKGDANGDGEVSSTDALQILRYSAGNRQFDKASILICDINGDGGLTSTDALQLLRVSAELRTLAW